MTAKDTELKPATVQSNAKMLQKEGRKILKKHEDRVGKDASQEIRASLAAIDHLNGAQDWSGLAQETERLDELLQNHASFARKSAIREIVESVGFAVGLALLLRCCTYEPFNIPSISMMPTLRIGDYIFVNKFTHGIQVPFTNHIVAEDMLGPIERGEVIVFRFPADESVDYIKRVIGLPGDVIRVQGQKMWIQKGGEGEFELIERKALERPCTQSEDPSRALGDCVVFRETLDDRSYLIRLVHDAHDLMSGEAIRTIRVPEGKYFVRGDNRQQSQDSLMWEQKADVAMVQKLLRQPDLEETLGAESLELRAQIDADLALDPNRARMTVHATKGGPAVQQSVQIWRKGPVSAEAIYQGYRHVGGLKWASSRVDKLLEASSMPQAQRASVLDQGRKWDALAIAEQGDTFHALMRWDSQDLVVHYQCGKQLCPDQGAVALALAQVVERAQKDPKARADELLSEPAGQRSSQSIKRKAPEPSKLRRRYYHGRYQKARNPKVLWTTEVFLKGHEGLDAVESARFAAAGSATSSAQLRTLSKGSVRWSKMPEGGFFAMWRAPQDQAATAGVALSCQAELCPNQTAFFNRIEKIQEDLFAVAKGNLRPAALMRTQSDLRPSSSHEQPERYPWDSAQSTSSLQGDRQSLKLDIDWKGPTSRRELLAQWRGPKAQGKEIESQLGTGAFVVDGPEAFRVGWVQGKTDTGLMLSCGKDLCDSESKAIAVANKISERASDENNFVARQMSIPQPFVPRGHIKGRSDIIWWPLSRFGQSMDVTADGEGDS